MLSLPLFRRSPKLFRHLAHFEGVLGTSLEVQVVSDKEWHGQEAEKLVLAEIDRLEAIFNAYRPDTELRRWQDTFEEEIVVSAELAQMLFDAEAWRQLTKNAFNPAVEALTRLWTRHTQQNTSVEPQEVVEVLADLKGPLWSVDKERCIARRHTQLPVTLNAIAKGFIIDAACRVAFQVEGVQEVLINIGGDLTHAGSKSINIAISDPRNDAENAVPIERVKVHNQGLATSGNYRRGFEIQGNWYSHLLDPRSGWPTENLIGVSVLAENAATADVLATAFSVLAPSHSLWLADSLGNVGTLLIDSEGRRFSNAYWNSRKT